MSWGGFTVAEAMGALAVVVGHARVTPRVRGLQVMPNEAYTVVDAELQRLRTTLAERTRERDANYFAATNAQQSERRIIDILEKVKRDRDERTRERDDARREVIDATEWERTTYDNERDAAEDRGLPVPRGVTVRARGH